MKPEDVYLREVYFEFRTVGKAVRVSAIDPRTYTEVAIFGDPKYGEAYLKNLAIKKLRFVMAKKNIGAKRRDPWEGL